MCIDDRRITRVVLGGETGSEDVDEAGDTADIPDVEYGEDSENPRDDSKDKSFGDVAPEEGGLMTDANTRLSCSVEVLLMMLFNEFEKWSDFWRGEKSSLETDGEGSKFARWLGNNDEMSSGF